jgi:SAM-dependent methyltransferase
MSSELSKLKAFWDARYASDQYAYGTAPNQYLKKQSALIPPGGRVLCLADGEGRNGVFLARQGFEVTSLDISTQGLEKGRALAAQHGVEMTFVAADINQFKLTDSSWDGIVSIFLHLPATLRRALHQRSMPALTADGVLIYQAYNNEQLGKGTGGPPEPSLLPDPQDVLTDFQGWPVADFYAGLRELNEGALHHGLGSVTEITAKRQVNN